MSKGQIALLAMLLTVLFVGCTSGEMPDAALPECRGFAGAATFTEMSKEEWEYWLRNELPARDSCTLPESRIQSMLVNFEEDQLNAKRWEHFQDLHQRMIGLRTAYREIVADDAIDDEEERLLCSDHDEWRAELEGILDYIDEYRKLEPWAISAQSVTLVESETQKLLVFLDDVATRCDPKS